MTTWKAVELCCRVVQGVAIIILAAAVLISASRHHELKHKVDFLYSIVSSCPYFQNNPIPKP